MRYVMYFRLCDDVTFLRKKTEAAESEATRICFGEFARMAAPDGGSLQSPTAFFLLIQGQGHIARQRHIGPRSMD